MPNSSKIFIIIPCYNEHKHIVQVVDKLLHQSYNIILVDDGSVPALKTVLDSRPVYYLRHIVNLGQGAALRTGMNFAKKLGADIIVHFDGDGQHRVSDISKMIDVIINTDVDIVLGSRFIDQENAGKVPPVRKIILKLARIVNWLLTGLWLSDAHNGFRAMNKKALHKISLRQNRMAHATEILQHIKKNKLKYKEVSVEISYSDSSKEKGQSNWNVFNILFDLLIRKNL